MLTCSHQHLSIVCVCIGSTCMCVGGCGRGCSNGVVRLCWLIAMLCTGACVLGVATAAGAEVAGVMVMGLVDCTGCAGPFCMGSSKRSENSELLLTNCSISVERKKKKKSKRERDNEDLIQHPWTYGLNLSVKYDKTRVLLSSATGSYRTLYTPEQCVFYQVSRPRYPSWRDDDQMHVSLHPPRLGALSGNQQMTKWRSM